MSTEYYFYTVIVSEYFGVNKMLLTARYSFYTVIWVEYFAVDEILLTAKFSRYTITESEKLAGNEISLIMVIGLSGVQFGVLSSCIGSQSRYNRSNNTQQLTNDS